MASHNLTCPIIGTARPVVKGVKRAGRSETYNQPMVNEALRAELVAMRQEDKEVRQELVDSGELGGSYVPRMEVVHRKNAARLRELIDSHGWPTVDLAGEDGAEAAWF